MMMLALLTAGSSLFASYGHGFKHGIKVYNDTGHKLYTSGNHELEKGHHKTLTESCHTITGHKWYDLDPISYYKTHSKSRGGIRGEFRKKYRHNKEHLYIKKHYNYHSEEYKIYWSYKNKPGRHGTILEGGSLINPSSSKTTVLYITENTAGHLLLSTTKPIATK